MKFSLKTTLLSATAFILVAQPAFADAETEALRAEVKKLMQRIDQLEKREKTRSRQDASAPSAATLEPSAGGRKASSSLDQRLAIVERNQELAKDDAKAKAEKNPTVEATLGKGFAITSPDKQYSIRLRGSGQADSRTFFNNTNASNGNQFLLRSVRPVMEAKLTDYFAAKLQYDVNANTVTDAYVDGKLDPLFNLRVGKLKLPLGLERWQSELDLITIERGQTNNLVPDRDIGVMAFGQIIPDQLEYHLAMTDGSPDLVNPTGNLDDNMDVTARLFAHPFRNNFDWWVQGIGLGLAGSYGNHMGNAGTSNLTTGYRTPAQATYFAYQGGTFADGTKWRLNPQAYYYHGPFSLLGEYIINSEEVRRTTTHNKIDNRAWFAAATYVLTGEDAAFDGVKPAHNFDLKSGEWGAFEVMARYGELDVDNSAFPLYALPTTAASQANEAIAGINWYINPALKLQADFALTKFKGGAVVGDREDEKVFRTRTQFRF